MLPIVLMETELPIPVIGYFAITFVILLSLLAAVLLFGQGRPDS